MMDEQRNAQAADAGKMPAAAESDTLEITLEDEAPSAAGEATEVLLAEPGGATELLVAGPGEATEVLVAEADQVTELLASSADQVTELLAAQSDWVADELAGDDAPAEAADAPADDIDLVVELDEEEPAPAAPAPASGTETLEICADDLLVVDLDDSETALPSPARKAADLDLSTVDFSSEPAPIAAKAPAWGEPVGGGLPGRDEPSGKSAGPVTAAFSYSGVLVMAAAGLLGGLLGWGVTEPLQSIWQSSSLFSLVAQTALYAALAGGAIGLMLGIGNGFSAGVFEKALRWAAFGLLWGALGGAVGGGLAQKIYGALSVDYTFAFWAQLLLRAAGWSIMGVFFGLGQSAVVIAEKKMRNGILGGALGGLLGGAAFQLLTVSANGPGGRCLALCAMGLCIGALIGLVEEAAKEAWVRVTGGPLTGKQFILYEERTIIGSSPACSITLIKDPNVAPEHAVIQNDRTEFIIAALLPGAVVLVNGRPTARRVLEDGDSIAIGASQFEFRERKKDEEQQPRKPMWGRVK
ncbi:MAG: FHA domain-containing protein [Armatimonadota bacterium]